MSGTPMSPEQLSEANAGFAAWLVKKAREYRATGSRQHALQADAIATLASKVARGAVRPDNLRSPLAQGGPEDEAAELLTGGERLRVERDRYRAAWQSARERATAHREGTLRQVATRDQIQRWLKEREAEVELLRAELATRPTRTEADAEVQAATDGMREAWTAEVEHLQRQLDARPSRAAVLRSGAQELADRFESEGRPGWGDTADWCADELRRMADATEQGEQGEQESGSPTPLRWGLGDAEMGDDDSVTLWLSGPDDQPYVLELEPERAAALRAMLAERSYSDCCCEPERDHNDLTMPTAYLHQVGCPVAAREGQEAGR